MIQKSLTYQSPMKQGKISPKYSSVSYPGAELNPSFFPKRSAKEWVGPWENNDYASKNPAAIVNTHRTLEMVSTSRDSLPGCCPAVWHPHLNCKSCRQKCPPDSDSHLILWTQRSLCSISSDVGLSDLVKLCSRSRESPQIFQSFYFLQFFG